MWSYNYSCELYHFGIKGMHWGFHKDRNTGSGTRIKRKKQSIYDSGRFTRDDVKQLSKEVSKIESRKKMIKKVAGTALAAATVYALYKYGKTPAGKEMSKKILEKVGDKTVNAAKKYSKIKIEKASAYLKKKGFATATKAKETISKVTPDLVKNTGKKVVDTGKRVINSNTVKKTAEVTKTVAQDVGRVARAGARAAADETKTILESEETKRLLNAGKNNISKVFKKG